MEMEAGSRTDTSVHGLYSAPCSTVTPGAGRSYITVGDNTNPHSLYLNYPYTIIFKVLVLGELSIIILFLTDQAFKT